MLASITITLKGDKTKHHSSNIAYLLHGAIMELIPPEYAEYLHTSRVHPYSQYAEASGDIIKWTINTLNAEAKDNIIGILENRITRHSMESVYLKQRSEALEISDYSVHTSTYEALIEKYFFEEPDRYINIRIITPAAFKSNGKYCILPSPRLFFQSLMIRYDMFSEKSSIFSPELLEHYESYSSICDYRLKSTRFTVERVKIPSFTGDLKIKISGPQQMVNLAWILAEFAEYAGIGIKTGMGMGGVLLHI